MFFKLMLLLEGVRKLLPAQKNQSRFLASIILSNAKTETEDLMPSMAWLLKSRIDLSQSESGHPHVLRAIALQQQSSNLVQVLAFLHGFHAH